MKSSSKEWDGTMSKQPPFGDGMTPAERNVAWNYRSKVDRLIGQVEALIESGRRDAKKIEALETKQHRLDGFRAHMS